MAKRQRKNAAANTAARAPAATLTPRDRKTLGVLKEMANDVVTAAEKRRDPYLDIPARNLSNVKYNRIKR
ncbi:MAG TPA: DNA topoisomerase VI, partial [Pirellulales bacterium]